MARRRFNRSKTAPDMGWVVGAADLSFAATALDVGSGGASVQFLFDFADVDADAITGRIEQDKSDWFVKRVIIDAYAAASFTNVTPTDTARLWAMGLGVIGVENANEIGADELSVYSAEATNLYARTFRTYSRPVYASALIGYTGDFNLATENVTSGGPSSYGVTSTPWGGAHVRDDFEVSNAGLRNNQACCIHVSMEPGPASYDWDTGDVLYIRYFYRVLMQKRR